jgi:hypothetical protein
MKMSLTHCAMACAGHRPELKETSISRPKTGMRTVAHLGCSELADVAGAPIRAGGASPLRGGDRRRRELGLESPRRRSPARSDRRHGYLDRPTGSLSLGTPAAGSWRSSSCFHRCPSGRQLSTTLSKSSPRWINRSRKSKHITNAKSVTYVPGRKCYLCTGTFRWEGKQEV